MDPERKPAPQGYCLFDTAIGACGVAWNERGLTRVQLPESTRQATERRLRARSPGVPAQAPPPPIEQLIALLKRYFAGENVDFATVPVDLANDTSPLHRRIYDIARAVGWGRTMTYGDIARELGEPDAREVGQAMSQNPVPIVVPCHRIVAAGNKLGGFSAPGGRATKERLLALEGVGVGDDAPRLPGL
jgi:methylated-DNA-[protein]-cysteine S-methyltransferase